jgi:hypothetical protein
MTAEFGLVMPYVSCVSSGGLYDDEPYVAGWEVGVLDVVLATLALGNRICELMRRVRTGNVPQLDLVAMQHGWTMTSTVDDEHPEWSAVTFRRTPDPKGSPL